MTDLFYNHIQTSVLSFIINTNPKIECMSHIEFFVVADLAVHLNSLPVVNPFYNRTAIKFK